MHRRTWILAVVPVWLASLAMFGAYLFLGHWTIVGLLSVGGLVLHAQAAGHLDGYAPVELADSGLAVALPLAGGVDAGERRWVADTLRSR